MWTQTEPRFEQYTFRLALLEDIHKQIAANKSTPTPPFRRIDGSSANSDNEYEEGVASGYAIHNPIPSGFVSPQNHLTDADYETYNRYPVAGNKAGIHFDYWIIPFPLEDRSFHCSLVRK